MDDLVFTRFGGICRGFVEVVVLDIVKCQVMIGGFLHGYKNRLKRLKKRPKSEANG